MATINGALATDLDFAVGASGADRTELGNALLAIYGPESNYGLGTKDGGTPATATDFYSGNGIGAGKKLGIAGVNATNTVGNTSLSTLSLTTVFNDAIITGTAAGNLTGNANDNVLGGNSAANIITGGGGNDTVVSGGGNDKVTTTGGNDSILGGTGNDTILAGDGNNTIDGGAGNDGITSGAGNDVITDFEGTNKIIAGNGTNTITTGAGKDSITGGSGADNINSGAGNDTIVSGSGGNDIVNSGIGNDVVTTGAGNDDIDTGDGRDSIKSGAGNDTIESGAGNDTILGEAGNDVIEGGFGSDSLTGGSGDDVFVIGADGLGNDTINDFSFTTDADGNVSSTDTLTIYTDSVTSALGDHDFNNDGLFNQEDFTLIFNSNPTIKGVTIDFNDGGTVLLKNVNFDDLFFVDNGDGTGSFTVTQGGGNL